MAHVRFDLYSKHLHVVTNVSVILPRIGDDENPRLLYSRDRRYPVVYLLHGSNCNDQDWLMYTNIVRYAEERRIMVVLPSVLNSDYSNYSSFADGFAVWDYLNEELMPMAESWLPGSDDPMQRFIAGLSMGGNGALMMALGHPEKYAGVAVLSSTAREIEYMRPYAAMTGEEFRWAAQDVLRFPGPNGTGMRAKEINAVAKYPTVGDYLSSVENAWDRFIEVAKSGRMPKLFVCCGTEDQNVYPRFLRFRHLAEELGVQATFVEYPGYKHEWTLWDKAIQQAMDYFGL